MSKVQENLTEGEKERGRGEKKGSGYATWSDASLIDGINVREMILSEENRIQ